LVQKFMKTSDEENPWDGASDEDVEAFADSTV